jgi:uncharacterized OsmC-like protein
MSTETVNGIDLPALKAFSEAVKREPQKGMTTFSVTSQWQGQTRSAATVSHYTLGGEKIARQFRIEADEPPELLGENTAPNPQELLLSALNACMIVGYAANAAALGITLIGLEIETEGELDLRGFLGLDAGVKPGYEAVRCTVRIKSLAPRDKLDALHQIVLKTSPNFSNLTTPIRINPDLVVDAV